MSRRVLVTGGAGFLGAALVRELVGDGEDVVVLDDGSRGSFQRLEDLRGRFTAVEGDVTDVESVCRASRGCEIVHHLAAVNGTRHFYEQPRRVFEVALRGSLAVADAARAEGVRRVLFASSSEVYHEPPQVPTPENVPLVIADLRNPRFSYAGGKLASELIARHLLGGDDGPEAVIFRPHNVYGPCMGYEHVIPNLVAKLRAGLEQRGRQELLQQTGEERVAAAGSESSDGAPEVELELMGDGSETRAFCYVDDAARAIALLAERGSAGGVYHVGRDEETTIAELARRLGRVLGLRVELRAGPPAPGAPRRRCPAIGELRALGHTGEVDLDEGLRRTAAWYWDHPAPRAVE